MAGVVIACLAIAMGVNTSLFAVFHAAALRPWPVRDPGTVAIVASEVPADLFGRWTERLRAAARLERPPVVDIAASRPGGSTRIAGRRVRFEYVSSNYFQLLGVSMAVGRDLGGFPDDALPLVLSERLWRETFGADAGIVGRTLSVEAVSFIVVGVAASPVRGPLGRTDIWIPLSASSRLESRGPDVADALGLTVAVRLENGVAHEQAAAWLAAVPAPRAAAASSRVHLTATDRYSRAGRAERLLYQAGFVLMLFVTLIACSNVSNLLLARSLARRRDLAVRAALGATTWRIIRQLALEATVLTTIATALAVLIAGWLPTIALRTLSELPIDALDLGFDVRLLAYAAILGAVATCALGWMPAVASQRMSVAAFLHQGGGETPTLKHAIPRYQVIISMMLLTSAGLVVRGIHAASTRHPGYSMDQLVVARLEFPATYSRQRRDERSGAFANRVQGLVGVDGIANASFVPTPGRPVALDPPTFVLRAPPRHVEAAAAHITVSAPYLDLLGIGIRSGRGFAGTDRPGTVAIVNEAFVRRFSQGAPTVGATLSRGGRQLDIVGIADDAFVSTMEAVEPMVFELRQDRGAAWYVLRDAAGLAATLRGLAAEIDPDLYLEVSRGDDWTRRSVSQWLSTARIVGALGVLALSLAAVGVFSVSAYAVQQRRREIGIRLALGASSRRLLEAVLAPTAIAVARGAFVGTLGAFCAGALMARWHWLNGLSPADPVTYAGALALVGAASITAALWPATRALLVDPAVTLRND